MDKSTLKKSILRTVESELDSWLEEEPKITDPYEYEKRLLDRTLHIGKAIMENSQGKLSRDRNTKKSLDNIWSSRIK